MVHIVTQTEIARNSFYRKGVLKFYMFRKFETSIIDIFFLTNYTAYV